METKVNEIEINGIKYVPKNSIKKEFYDDIRIVVLQRGWVYIGIFEQDGQYINLHNAYNIRLWGTTKGLPELINGPTSSTKLDKCENRLRFHELTMIFSIDVNKQKWSQYDND